MIGRRPIEPKMFRLTWMKRSDVRRISSLARQRHEMILPDGWIDDLLDESDGPTITLRSIAKQSTLKRRPNGTNGRWFKQSSWVKSRKPNSDHAGKKEPDRNSTDKNQPTEERNDGTRREGEGTTVDDTQTNKHVLRNVWLFIPNRNDMQRLESGSMRWALLCDCGHSDWASVTLQINTRRAVQPDEPLNGLQLSQKYFQFGHLLLLTKYKYLSKHSIESSWPIPPLEWPKPPTSGRVSASIDPMSEHGWSGCPIALAPPTS